MSWGWTFKRWLISCFVFVHVGATLLWNLPPSALRVRVFPAIQCYLLPLGFGQFWGMFAPNPPSNEMHLVALTKDNRGLLRSYDFPCMAGKPLGEAFWGFRYSKHMYNFDFEEMKSMRQSGARHAVRELKIAENAFPVDVELIYEIKPIAGPGEKPDPLAPIARKTLERYRFPSMKEVRP